MSDLGDLRAALADRYAIERELGRGGNAVVYLAHDVKHDRNVALKVLLPELALSVRTERFLREIQIAARLSHPSILALHDSGEANGALYYVMPFVEGESLRDRLKREKQLPIDDALAITGEVASALDYAHSQGVIHRDIKPENIMLAHGKPVVMDFGIARALTAAGGQTVTETGIAVGTPAYMSPEQASGSGEVDARSDIYSLGCVLYEMLAGHPPFTGATAQEILARHALDPVPTVTAARPGVPEPVQQAVRKALAKAPVDRFAAATDFAAALTSRAAPASPVRPGRKAAAVVATLLALVLGAWYVVQRWTTRERGHDATWARTIAIPRILHFAEEGKWDSAWSLARTAAIIIPDDSVMESVWPRIAQRMTVETDPPDASVYRSAYAADDAWDYLGRTPLRRIWLPSQISRLRFAKNGYDTVDVLLHAGRVATAMPGARMTTLFKLYARDTLPRGMVHVNGALYQIRGELEHIPPIELHDYLIGKYEVTNGQFKAFVLAGGYRARKYWREPFVKDGRPVRWEDAMALFVDRTARPGPATWEAGDYPEGQEDYPVGGVSWYEAAAYARFADRALPTIYHWYNAAGPPVSAWIVPRSNFLDRGPARVGTYAGMSEFGTYDMAGNVREWCSNESEGRRYILGGGWNDGDYMFSRSFAQTPWDRSLTNGMRLVKYLDPRDPGGAARPIPAPHRDFSAEQPVSDEVFAYYRRLFQYDPIPLQPVLETIDSTPPFWIKEKVSFAAGYGIERMSAFLFLPRDVKPPYQTVVFFPGSQAFFSRSSVQLVSMSQIDFIVRGGRAVIYPIYKSTFERGDDALQHDIPNESNAWKEHVIMWVKDLRRSIDYAQTRPDLDLQHLAYYGYSWGGRMAPFMLVVEPRIKVAVLNLAGFRVQRAQPEADALNYVPRVKVPVLMLSGRYDHLFPLGTSAVPFFQLLGTPPAQKRHVISEGGHFVPRPQLIRETLDWLDHYVGPVQAVVPRQDP